MEGHSVQEFVGDDKAYLAWLGAHPQGYVLNTERSFSSDEMVLHGAWCTFISMLLKGADEGGFTERDYVKICADRIEDLSAWVGEHGRPDGTFRSTGCVCGPLGQS